ncbi:MAG: hypothetical protein KDE53_25260, partial [Caldilineaceae bacterium]|nr:hypothetical protein [Caldilineaceae bacterium]MCB0122678.1 hypothetical protein [Caldilineaceae bacterium]
MKALKPKEQHEHILAVADKQKIAQYLIDGQEQDITKIAVILARQCNLFVHFQRLWRLRVAELDPQLTSENYMLYVYSNKNSLYKKLVRDQQV